MLTTEAMICEISDESAAGASQGGRGSGMEY
jgi:hypothetical protein